MNQNFILELNNIFRNVFDDKSIEITPETSAKEIEAWNSMNHILLINEIEKYYNIEFELDELISINTVGDILQILQSKVNK
ncbi:MAG: acyl carrier protein [Paludibacter sp.]|nr:acyl carrier protein [Paludibacter sp.]